MGQRELLASRSIGDPLFRSTAPARTWRAPPKSSVITVLRVAIVDWFKIEHLFRNFHFAFPGREPIYIQLRLPSPFIAPVSVPKTRAGSASV